MEQHRTHLKICVLVIMKYWFYPFLVSWSSIKLKTIAINAFFFFCSLYSLACYFTITWHSVMLYYYFLVAVVQLLSHVWIFTTPWTETCQAFLPFTISQSLLKLMSTKSMMPSIHLMLCFPLVLPPSIFPSIRVFSWIFIGRLDTEAEALILWPPDSKSQPIRKDPYLARPRDIWYSQFLLSSVQFSLSVVSKYLWPRECSTPGLSVHHQLPEHTQAHVYQGGDAIQPSIPLSSPFPSTFNLTQHQDLFKWVNSSLQVAKGLEFQLQHQSFQWIPSTVFLLDWLVWSSCSPRGSQESSPKPQFKGTNFLALRFLHSPTLTSIHDYWKNHSFDYMDLYWQSNVSAF